MPKMKTDSGAKKRIKVTGSGKLRREPSGVAWRRSRRFAPVDSVARPTSLRPWRRRPSAWIGHLEIESKEELLWHE